MIMGLHSGVKVRIKRFLAIGLLLVIMGFVLINIVAYNQAYAMLHFTKAGIRTQGAESLTVGQKAKVLFCGVEFPRPNSDLTPEALDAKAGALTINCTNSVRLSAWYCVKTNSASRPLVILFHG